MSASNPPSPVSSLAPSHQQNPTLTSQNTTTPQASGTPIPQPPPVRSGTQLSASPSLSPPSTSSTANGARVQTSPRPAQNRRQSSGHSKKLFARLHSAFSPSTHDLKDPDLVAPDTVRPYLHKQQRHRLQRKSWSEWLLTLLLCIAYFLILILFQRDQAIDTKHRRIFNALVTGTVLLLGVNLNNSLRSYAKMIRWRFLAAGYRPLKQFDLIMGCDSITNVVSLLRHGRNKEKKFPFNSMVQLYALIWLIVQLGIVVCIGIIGLTYNLEISRSLVNTQTGETSSINLTSLSSGSYLYDLSVLQQWGIRGLALNRAPYDTLEKKYAPYGSYLSNGEGQSRRFFVDYNPGFLGISAVTPRYMDSSVACTQYRVTDGEFGNLTYISYDVDGQPVNETLFDLPGPSGLYVTANTNSSCGSRCTSVVLFQAQSLEENYLSGIYIDHALRFECNNTVSNVKYLNGDIDLIYQIPEFLSRMLGGMLGWSATPPNGTRVWQVYQEYSQIGWNSAPTEVQVADDISQWTIAGVAAMDANDSSSIASGIPRMIVPNGAQPIQAQILHVKWWAAGTILGAIPFVQFWTLILVIFFANKVIIKDDSPIAVAKVYQTVLNKIGDQHGCMLTGDQLIDSLEADHQVSNVIYGVADGANGIKHVDLCEQVSGVQAGRSFPEGDYDGVGPIRRRPRRMIDTQELF